MTVYDQNHYQTGAVLNRPVRTVVVHDGRRGPRGLPGPQGEPGEQGDSFRLRGQWVASTVYCPLDAVSWRSSALPGVTSLFIQKETSSCALSTTEPHLDLGRWTEIGANKLGDAFGGIWQVQQTAHGFTKVGQPIAYSRTADRYVLADARILAELAIAVVREVVSPDVVILQSTGEVPGIDPTIILPDGSDWDPGHVYYVSTVQGRLELVPPTDPSAYANPILIATDEGNGVVLPWTPAGGAGSLTRQLVGTTKFHFQLGAPSQTISGNDLDGNELAYFPGQVDVFVNGANLFRGAYTAVDGETITFFSVLPTGSEIEVWTAAQATVPVLPATSLKLDNIEVMFDGFRLTFPLTANAVPVPLQSAVNLRLWLDATAQEAFIDFDLIEDPENEGFALLEMAQPPEEGTRFWAILMQAAADAYQIEMRATDTAIEWRYVSGPDTDWETLVPLADLVFQVDALGLFADRDDYDDEAPGFTYLATDTGYVYFRQTDTPGVWSDPAPFVGPPGEPGEPGAPGQSAYDIAVANGFMGDEAAWLASLQGEDGAPGEAGAEGDSAYEIALDNGFVGSEAEWLASLQGEDGEPGEDGAPGVSELLVAEIIDGGDLTDYDPDEDDFEIDTGTLP